MSREIEYTITIEEEDQSPADCFATGDEEQDAEIVKDICERVQWNLWAWCVVCVTARFDGMKGTAYLGACSYKNEEDFKADGYFEQMKEEAREDLEREIEEARKAVAAWDEDN